MLEESRLQAQLPMHTSMAVRAKGDQVRFHIISRVAAELKVMHLQAVHSAACLAAPPVTPQNLTVQFAITPGVEPEWRVLAETLLLHEGFA